MSKIANILEGIKHFVSEDPEVERIASQRMEVCSPCQYRFYYNCTKCGCFLPLKSRSISETCPKGKWKD